MSTFSDNWDKSRFKVQFIRLFDCASGLFKQEYCVGKNKEVKVQKKSMTKGCGH